MHYPLLLLIAVIDTVIMYIHTQAVFLIQYISTGVQTGCNAMVGCKPTHTEKGNKKKRQRLMDSSDQKKTLRQKLISSICTGQISLRKWVFFLSSFLIDPSFYSPSLVISITPTFLSASHG